VPSLSNVAIRSETGTKSGEPLFVTRSIKAMIASLAQCRSRKGTDPEPVPAARKPTLRRQQEQSAQDSNGVAALVLIYETLQLSVDLKV
jgi:hypothetical protein